MTASRIAPKCSPPSRPLAPGLRACVPPTRSMRPRRRRPPRCSPRRAPSFILPGGPARTKQNGARRASKISFTSAATCFRPCAPPMVVWGCNEPDPELRQRCLQRSADTCRQRQGCILDDAGRHRGEAGLWRSRSQRPRFPRHLSGQGAVPARALSSDVRGTALDHPAIRRFLHGGGFQRLLPAQPRGGAEGPFHRLRSRHPPRLRQRPPARRRRCRHGGRGDRTRSTTCARCSPASRSTR